VKPSVVIDAEMGKMLRSGDGCGMDGVGLRVDDLRCAECFCGDVADQPCCKAIHAAGLRRGEDFLVGGLSGFVEGCADFFDVGAVGADGFVELLAGDVEFFGPVGDVGCHFGIDLFGVVGAFDVGTLVAIELGIDDGLGGGEDGFGGVGGGEGVSAVGFGHGVPLSLLFAM